MYVKSRQANDLLKMFLSMVSQWLGHSPLVLEVPGSIPARGKKILM